MDGTKFLAVAACLAIAPLLHALNARKTLTQYTRTVWTQEHGLPQDTIRAIAQTNDGYLWLGTDEGLARFDGFEFVVFTKDKGMLPSNSVGALYAAADGSLWIGTSGGLTVYRNRKFTTYTKKDGLADTFISSLTEDRGGALWIAAGISLSRFEDGKFTNYAANNLGIDAIRTVYTDRDGTVWVAGFGGVSRLEGDRFNVVLHGPEKMGGDIVSSLLKDRQGNLWIGGSTGLLMLSASGTLRNYQTADGLPDNFVRSLWEDRDGNLWAGTNGGLARFENGRFVASTLDGVHERDWVRCIFEDRDGNLWVGMNSGLDRYRDDIFTIYAQPDGLPSAEPTTVFQDRRGRIWIGFHDRGLVEFSPGRSQVFTTKNGLPSNEIFSIREDRAGDLLIATRAGACRLHNGVCASYSINDPLNRKIVFDFLEDHGGRLWLASPGGLDQIAGRKSRKFIGGGPLLNDSIVVLSDDSLTGGLWAGTYGNGLWHLQDGRTTLYTVADGLPSNQIRALLEDVDRTLWIGSFDGGLAGFRAGKFFRVTTREGLLSDNVAHIEDDGKGSLWLSTTRGLCRVDKASLRDFANGKVRNVNVINYGVADGLRSAQCAPGYPTSRGGTKTTDGRLWFPTSRGLAVIDPTQTSPAPKNPTVHLLDVVVDGNSLPLDAAAAADLSPGNGRVQFRYTGIDLGAPEHIRYFYRLEGLDRDWISAGTRRITNYNSLRHGNYRFVVRATSLGGAFQDAAFAFRLRPHFYETSWFLYLCGAALLAAFWGLYQLRLQQIRERFSLVLEERVRLAREIHDTLAQGFVGISSQLDAVAMSLHNQAGTAHKHLDLARKMARHSLTEARRSVMDLRASALEGNDLPAALTHAAREWTAGSTLKIQLDVAGDSHKLPEEMEQNLLRIAQEAVTNAVKHSSASNVAIRLLMDHRHLSLRVADDGNGFDQGAAFSLRDGHFGLLGMRERAERLGGELHLRSMLGRGTEVEVTVPLS